MFTGQIAMWSGTLGNIPAGWQLCDGTNGTPRLGQQFVRGSQGSYAIGDTGGATQHSHSFTSDGHNHQTDPSGDMAGGPFFQRPLSTTQVTGTTDVEANLPSWYSLAFIMRMI